MPTYLVERMLSGGDVMSLDRLSQALAGACQRAAADGKPIRYVRSTFTPGDSRCCCLFEASTADLVREVNDAAQLPFRRIVLAIDVAGP